LSELGVEENIAPKERGSNVRWNSSSGCQTVTAVMKNYMFWYIRLCSMVKVKAPFGVTCRFNRQGWRISQAIKQPFSLIPAKCWTPDWLSFQQCRWRRHVPKVNCSTQCYIPKHGTSHRASQFLHFTEKCWDTGRRGAGHFKCVHNFLLKSWRDHLRNSHTWRIILKRMPKEYVVGVKTAFF
jgi:hypothetical protein